MNGERAPTVLLGRSEEQGTLDQLLDAARAGRSSTLVIRGDAGVGKTALLQYVAEQASGCRLEELHGEAIDQLGPSRVIVLHARAELTYGEWLRARGSPRRRTRPAEGGPECIRDDGGRRVRRPSAP